MRGRLPQVKIENLFTKAALGFLFIIVAGVFFLPSYTRIKELKREKKELAENLRKMKKRIKELSLSNKSVKEGSFYIEKIGRENLGLAKDKEVIVHISRGGAAR